MRELFDSTPDQAAPDPQGAARQAARPQLRRRFYKEAGVAEAKDGQEGLFFVTLDGRPIRTPSGRPVIVPSRRLAETIASEWEAQGEMLEPMTMPLTRLANSVCEGVTDQVEAVRDDMARYFQSDLLFYRAGHPQALVEREAAHWDPVLFWAADELGAHFILAEGLTHVRQPEAAITAARAALPFDPWSIAALHVVTSLTGSALLALALFHHFSSADAVWAAAHVDDDWNAAQWGEDELMMQRRAARFTDFRAAVAVLEMVGQP